jgi:hypothetical protein
MLYPRQKIGGKLRTLGVAERLKFVFYGAEMSVLPAALLAGCTILIGAIMLYSGLCSHSALPDLVRQVEGVDQSPLPGAPEAETHTGHCHGLREVVGCVREGRETGGGRLSQWDASLEEGNQAVRPQAAAREGAASEGGEEEGGRPRDDVCSQSRPAEEFGQHVQCVSPWQASLSFSGYPQAPL